MKNAIWRWVKGIVLACALVWIPLCAAAQEYNAQTAQNWLEEFAAALGGLPALNDPQETADPARAGQYLIEYEFGTVLAARADAPQAGELLTIDVRTSQVTDCLGLRVGMSLSDALGGAQVDKSNTQLYVLGTQESGIGWSWAYVGDAGVYGVEYITYGGEDAAMTEYTLTYMIGDDGCISAIRMNMAQTTLAQAQDGLSTAEEIAQRQRGEVLALKNSEAIFGEADLQVMGAAALGVEVAQLVSRLGEPSEVQTLPSGGGRILLYDGLAAELGLREATGVEIVRGVSVSGADVTGPRGLRVGMSVQEAAALFACDADVYSVGGLLYMEGEALGEPPYGELIRGVSDEVTLRYVCQTASGENAVLEAGVQDGVVGYWHLFYGDAEAEGGI